MERKKTIKESYAIFFLYIIYIVGIIGHIFNYSHPAMAFLFPYVLFVTGIVVLFFIVKKGNFKLVVFCLIVYLVISALEITGTKSGFLFGNYNYSSVPGIRLFEFPLIIGFNWVLILLASIKIGNSINKNIFLVALLTATIAVLFELVLEPVALKLNYRKWENDIVPLKNYYTWGLIAFIFSLIASLMKIKISAVILEHYFMIQFLFF